MINSTMGILTVILLMITVALLTQKIGFMKSFVPPALVVIILGAILSNIGIMPFYHDSYAVIMNYAIPLFISIALLNVDLKGIFSLSKRALLAMVIAAISVSVITIIGSLIFAGRIEEGWKLGGMFVGTYTGGSANLSAIAVALDASPTTLAVANGADYVIGMPTLMLMFAMPAIMKKSKAFQKFWPYSLPEEELCKDDGSGELMGRKEWGIQDIAIMLAYGFALTVAADYLAALAPDGYGSVVRILSITTVSVIAAQTPFAKMVKGNMDLGMFIIMFFLSIVGLTLNIGTFASAAVSVTLFCAFTIFGSLALHLILARLLKIEYQYVLISIVAAISDASSAAMVAATGGWRSLVSIGVVLGIIGTVAGNYLGVAVAYIIRAIIGV